MREPDVRIPRLTAAWLHRAALADAGRHLLGMLADTTASSGQWYDVTEQMSAALAGRGLVAGDHLVDLVYGPDGVTAISRRAGEPTPAEPAEAAASGPAALVDGHAIRGVRTVRDREGRL